MGAGTTPGCTTRRGCWAIGFRPRRENPCRRVGNNGVRLIAADTLDEFVTLSTPGQSGATSLAYSPDGNRLAVGCESGVTYVWDLLMLRSELAKIGLDWD